MTITSIRRTAIVTAALATVAWTTASPHAAAARTHTPVTSSGPATYAPGARLDVGGAEQLLRSAVNDDHVKITPLGVHLGGNGWSGGTLLR